MIYVSSYGSDVYVFTTDGQLVQTLSGFYGIGDICSDSKGDVWVTDQVGATGTLYEYAHGGTSPIATLYDEYSSPQACAVDPVSGDLAVAHFSNSVAIFKNAQGSAKNYSTGNNSDFNSISYDSRGNLYVAGYIGGYKLAVSWMPRRSSSFTDLTLFPKIFPHEGLQWDGTHLAIATNSKISQYRIRHKEGKRVGSASLGTCCLGHFAIAGSLLVTTDAGYDHVQLFKYPEGGNPTLTISNVAGATGVAISIEPSRR